MDSQCSTNIITETLGANCYPDWFNKIRQTERKAEDFTLKASQESPGFFGSSRPCFFFFFFFPHCRAQHNLKSSLQEYIAVLQLPEQERKLFGSLSSIKCAVGCRQGAWFNLLVEAIVILALQKVHFSVCAICFFHGWNIDPFACALTPRLPKTWLIPSVFTLRRAGGLLRFCNFCDPTDTRSSVWLSTMYLNKLYHIKQLLLISV